MSQLLTRDFLALVAAQTSFAFAFASYFLLPKFLATELGAGASEIGLVTASFGVTAGIGIPLVGIGVDRFGRRRFVVAGSLLMTAVCLAYLGVHEVGKLLFALRMLQGASFAMVYIGCSTLAVDLAPRDRLAQAVGLFGVSFLVMHAISPAVVETVVDHFGWDPVFPMTAVGAALCCVLALRLPEPPRPHAEVPVPGLWSVVRQPRSLRIGAVIGLCGAAFGTVLTFHQPLALERGAVHVRGFFVAYALAAIGVRVFLGGLADRAGRRRVSLAALGVYGLVVAAMGNLTPGSLAPLGLAFGAAHGLFYPAFNALALEAAGDHERGKVMALFNGSFNVGFSCATLALGFVAQAQGYPMVFHLAGLGVFAGVGLFLLSPDGRAA